MIIIRADNWLCYPQFKIDDYMNLYFYKGDDLRYYNDIFGYQNMFITLEINNKMYREDF